MHPPTHIVQSEQLFDSFAADLVDNPYPHYDRVRSAEPVYWEPVLQAWVLTRHDCVSQVLKNEMFEVSSLSEAIAQFGRKMRRDYTPLVKAAASILFFINGERHKADRRTLGRVLTNIPLSQLQPVIREFAKSVADALSDRREFDAVRDYAQLFPALVMTRVLGLPPSDAPQFLEWANDSVDVLDIVTPSVYDRLNRKAAEAMEHLRWRIMRLAPTGDRTGLSVIYEAVPFDGDTKLAAAAALAFTLFMIGTATTSSLIASCINTLLRQPELYRRARANPLLAAPIVAEVTRLESPVQRAVRIARGECIIGGRTIQQNDRILLLLGAANRDPSVFPSPAVLDVDRRDKDDLAFGVGKHACLGKSLAKLEVEIAVERFLKMPPLELVELREIWHPVKTIRTLTCLPVRFTGTP